MKRSDVEKALDEAFDETLKLQYRNVLVDPLNVDRPDRAAIEEKFQRVLRINLEAFAMAMRAIQLNTMLEDDDQKQIDSGDCA